MSDIIYEKPSKRKHKCTYPDVTLLPGSLAQCPECKRYLVVGWVDYDGIAITPGWKRLRWWHLPSQLRLRKIRKEKAA